MTTEAPNWWREEYIAGATHLFQSKGNLVRGTIKDGKLSDAKSGYFRLAGAGTASKMPSGGGPNEAVPMNAGRTKVKVDIDNYQAAEWIEETDLDKMDLDERQEAQATAAMALGRKFDDVVYRVLDAGTGTFGTAIGAANTAWTIPLAMAAINALQKRDVPWDGDVYCILPPTAWNQMLINQVFSNSQWSDEKSLAQGVTAKKWNGVNWVLGYEELFATPSGTGKRFFMYHKSAIGGLTNKEMQSRITWENTKTAWFANNWMGFGAKVLQGGATGGIIECLVDSASAIS